MKITRLAARNFLSMAAVDAPVNESMTVVTGPNGVGKTSLARIVDVVATALHSHAIGRWDTLDVAYGGAGRFGSTDWSVTLGISFDDTELEVLDDWLRGCLITLIDENENNSTQILDLVLSQKNIGTFDLFKTGAIEVDYDSRRRQHWRVSWLTDPPTTSSPDTTTLVDPSAEAASSDTNAATATHDDRPDTNGNAATPDSNEEVTPPERSDVTDAQASHDSEHGSGSNHSPESDHNGDHAPEPGTDEDTDTNRPAQPPAVIRIDLTRNIAVADGAAETRPQFTTLARDSILKAQEHYDMPQAVGQPVPEGFNLPTVTDLARAGGIDLAVNPTNNDPAPEPVRNVFDAVGVDLNSNQRVVFAHLATLLLQRSVVVVDNVRMQPRRHWNAADLQAQRDLASGEQLALALWADKNGNPAGRARFARTQALFTELTASTSTLDVTADPGHEPTHEFTVTPILSDGAYDIPLHLSGAGQSEAALLAALLATEPPVLVLDEPATNLSTAAQRRVTAALETRAARGGQTILITHSSNLVPTANLNALLNLRRSPDGVIARRLDNSRVNPTPARLLRFAPVRDALFASGVLLTEGQSDAAALRTWLAQTSPTLQQAGVLLIEVGGDKSFISHFEVFEALAIPWAALVDGPALKRRLGGYRPQAPQADFDEASQFWAQEGVYTLAQTFGVDDCKGRGELEAFFERIDQPRWAKFDKKHRRNKPLAAAQFADDVPVPEEITTLWNQVLRHLQLPTG